MDREELVDRVEQAGLASRVDLERALSAPAARSLSPEVALLQAGVVEEMALAELVARVHRLPLADLSGRTVLPEVLGLIPREVAEYHMVFPLARSEGGDTLTLAMADPVDVVAEDVVRFRTRLRIERVVATRSGIREAIEEHYGLGVAGSLLNKLPSLEGVEFCEWEDGEEPEGEGEGTDDVHAGPIVQLVNALLLDAIRLRASDIHVEPGEDTVRVRYRIDGLLRTIAEMPRRVRLPSTARFKLMAGMDISETRRPQDGRARMRTADGITDMRVSTLPGLLGEKVVCRLLRREEGLPELAALGLRGRDLSQVNALVRSPQGVLLVTGPTGSGKTTSLYVLLNLLNEERINILTVEDPVESQVRGIHQVQVHPRAGVTFADTLRAMLRQDPDVIMVGEIRDVETAEIAVEAAQTGHFVLSTLHTNDAPSTVVRLLQMGIAPYLLASSLLGVVAQRLVRKLCLDCRRPAAPDPDLARFLAASAGLDAPESGWRAEGCEACGFTGYRGRIGLFEVLTMTPRLREMVGSAASNSALAAAARQEGMGSMLADGLRKAAEGLTSLEEVLRVAPVQRRVGLPCPGCSQPVEPEWQVCPRCGAGLASACPDCGADVLPDWAVCPRCRRTLGAPVEEPAAPAETARKEESDPRTRVLVVDDDPDLRQAIRMVLEGEGYRVFLAEDGAEGLAMAHRHRPHLILTDLLMPGMDGLELIRRLRSQLKTSLIPLIVLTSRGDDEGEVLGLEAGADDYLIKPVSPARLRARVAAALAHSACQEHTETSGGPRKASNPGR